MKQSPRVKRMEKRHKRSYTPPLMLTSLMDIFTVLVVFLLASASTQLPSSKDIVLPASSAINQPEETLIVQISNTDILVQGRKVADVRQVLQDDAPVIVSLINELKYREDIAQRTAVTDEDKARAKKVTIMGDEKIPFALLKKVMASCTQTAYTELSFAVLMKAEDA